MCVVWAPKIMCIYIYKKNEEEEENIKYIK